MDISARSAEQAVSGKHNEAEQGKDKKKRPQVVQDSSSLAERRSASDSKALKKKRQLSAVTSEDKGPERRSSESNSPRSEQAAAKVSKSHAGTLPDSLAASPRKRKHGAVASTPLREDDRRTDLKSPEVKRRRFATSPASDTTVTAELKEAQESDHEEGTAGKEYTEAAAEDQATSKSSPLKVVASRKKRKHHQSEAHEVHQETPSISESPAAAAAGGTKSSKKKKRKSPAAGSIQLETSRPAKSGTVQEPKRKAMDASSFLFEGQRAHLEHLQKEEEKAMSVTKHPHSGVKAVKIATQQGKRKRSAPGKLSAAIDPSTVNSTGSGALEFGCGLESAW